MDALRLFALVAIVVGHVYADNEWVDRSLQSWRLPLFFVITGYFFAGRRTIGQEAQKRFRSLLVPYAAWMVILTAGLIVVDRHDLHLAGWVKQAVLGGSYAGRPYTTMWFFTALFVAAVLFRVLQHTLWWVRTLVIVGGAAVNVLAGPALAKVPLSLATALGALMFLWLGQAVRSGQLVGAWWVRAPFAALMLGLSAAVALFLPGNFVPMDMKVGQFPVLAVILAGIMSTALMALVTAIQGVPPRVGRILAAAALPSAVVIAAHPFILLLLLPPRAVGVPSPLVAAAAVVVPLLIGLVVVRTPLAPLLAGVPRVRGARR